MARDTGARSVVRLLIPKFPAAFVGTGDLFTALCTAWLHNTGGSLQLTLERTIGTMQVSHASTGLLCDLCVPGCADQDPGPRQDRGLQLGPGQPQPRHDGAQADSEQGGHRDSPRQRHCGSVVNEIDNEMCTLLLL